VKTNASWSGWFGTRFSVESTYNTTAKLSSSTSNNDKLNTKAKYQVSIMAENRQPVGLTKILDRLISNDKLVPAPP
jgi:L,D-peptidoglycan transpeptidase YkuD (ErfK/YbiS/YcfS/YnhG family)